jgi:hypothetical protein
MSCAEAETLWLSSIVAKEDSLKALEARLGEYGELGRHRSTALIET